MSVVSHLEEIELQLKAELDDAHRKMRDASNPVELVEAKRQYRKALRAFTRLVMDDILPEE